MEAAQGQEVKRRYRKAENVGFEPTVPLGTTVFKTAAIDHSAISPCAKLQLFLISQTNFEKKIDNFMF